MSENENGTFTGTCPVPVSAYDRIVLGHGSGGRMSAELVDRVFVPAFKNDTLCRLEDQAVCSLPNRGKSASGERIAFTTDSFVVRPIFFPGGDIGHLAVNGTVNDLAVGGAIPRWLSAAFILEEGLPIADLERVVASMRTACAEAGVQIVTGDTKVVDHGKGDQIFITTSGVGVVPPGRDLSIRSAKPGDVLLVSGTVGDHGIAIMSVREGLTFGTTIESDTTSLFSLTQAILESCPNVRCMRDPTRGGVASTVNELASASNVGVRLFESQIPMRTEVVAACELLGLDPLYVANEGKLVAVVPAADADRVLSAMRAHPKGRDAAIIGEVMSDHPKIVTVKSKLGVERVLTLLAGEQLPRIC